MSLISRRMIIMFAMLSHLWASAELIWLVSRWSWIDTAVKLVIDCEYNNPGLYDEGIEINVTILIRQASR